MTYAKQSGYNSTFKNVSSSHEHPCSCKYRRHVKCPFAANDQVYSSHGHPCSCA